MTDNPQKVTKWIRQVALFVAASVVAFTIPFLLVTRGFGSAGDQATDPPTSANAAQSASKPSTPTSRRPLTPAAAPSSGGPAAVDTADQQAVATLAATTEGCRLENLRQKAALGAAAVSLGQFQKHIDAMNLWVAGKISYSVATTFWDQTRVAATTNLAAFTRTDKELVIGTAKCQVLTGPAAGWAPSQTSQVQACVTGLAAGAKALALARQAAATWAHHVEDMEMLRMGHITEDQARVMWQKNWKLGQQQLRAYNTALAGAEKSPCAFD